MNNISVIIAAYNNASYLKEAINSVLNQTYKDFEVIVVDDGSTDNTRALVESMQSVHPGMIQYIYQQNQGPAPARNAGIRAAQGKYIAFLDADDIWLPDKLARQMECFQRDPETGFVYCDNIFVDENNSAIDNYVRKIRLVEGDILLELFKDFFIITSGVILKKECVEKIGLFNEKLLVGEDYEYFLRLAGRYKAGVVKEKLFRRRVHANSLSRQDYLLDAKNELLILSLYSRDNLSYYSQHKKSIKNRLAEINFSLAYRLLENGRNILAFYYLFVSLTYKISLGTVKNLFLCFAPL
ncbi:MAG: glycosyltransferase family 2 protein, partial [Candidatus Omnitrophica bacterium]|nr:glycosyltransferase family 2 protein [Candidatus Omnitrophota bacterium]